MILQPDTGTQLLGVLNFTYYGGTTTLVFNNSVMNGEYCEFADINGNILCDTPSAIYYINGAVIQSTVPTAPVVAISNSVKKCGGLPDTIDIIGGCLGDAENWFWYSGSCGGTYEGTGAPVVVFPSAATQYFVSKGEYHTSVCDSIILTVYPSSITPSGLTANSDSICSGSSTTISISVSNQDTTSIASWYSVSCGGIFLTSGLSPVFSPVTTTTFYLRYEGICNTTACASITITVLDSSAPAISVAANMTATCTADSVQLEVTGGNLSLDSRWRWYSGSCGGTFFLSGSQIIVQPLATTTYWLRAEGKCNTTSCVSIIILVTPIPADNIHAYTVQGLSGHLECQWKPGSRCKLVLVSGYLRLR